MQFYAFSGRLSIKTCLKSQLLKRGAISRDLELEGGGWCVEERMPPEVLVGLDRAAFISVWHDQDMSTFGEDVSSTLHSPLLNNAAMFFSFYLSLLSLVFPVFSPVSLLIIHYSL